MKRSSVESDVLVSVVVPTHGRTWELKRALESIVAQTYSNYEIIVISDNGNKREIGEHVAEIVRSIDRPIRLVELREPCGGGGARNNGIQLAQGDMVAFLDDDDEWLPDKLASQVPLLVVADCDIACIDTGFFRIDDVKAVRSVIRPHKMPRNAFEWLLLKEDGRAPKLSSLLCRKSALMAIGSFDALLPSRQDLDLYLRLSRHYRFLSIDEPLVINHIHTGPRITRNWHSKVGGYEVIYRKYYNEISGSSRIHGKYLARFGAMQLRAGYRSEGRRTLIRALKHYPLNPRAWKTILTSLFLRG